MARLTKKQKALQGKIVAQKPYPVGEALALAKESATAKFDESIDAAVNLGVDPRKSDQVVRGSVVLPAGTGKSVRVAVFAQGDKAEAAKAAGAEIVGFEDLAAEVKADEGEKKPKARKKKAAAPAAEAAAEATEKKPRAPRKKKVAAA